jgi:hypothetical protein
MQPSVARLPFIEDLYATEDFPRSGRGLASANGDTSLRRSTSLAAPPATDSGMAARGAISTSGGRSGSARVARIAVLNRSSCGRGW